MTLEQSIHDSLDNAVTNGHALQTWSVSAIVADLQQCDAEAEKHDAATLEPFVKSWLESFGTNIEWSTRPHV
jgi:hypothetical protein